MKHIRQPEGSSLCGQCCVAMFANVSLETAIRAFVFKGKIWRGATSTWQLVEALRALGVVCEEKLRRIRIDQPIPERAILSVRIPRPKYTGGHWIAVSEGLFFDPEATGPTETPLIGYPANTRIVSFLEIHS